MLLCWLLELISGLLRRKSELIVGFGAFFTMSQLIHGNVKDVF